MATGDSCFFLGTTPRVRLNVGRVRATHVVALHAFETRISPQLGFVLHFHPHAGIERRPPPESNRSDLTRSQNNRNVAKEPQS